MYINMLGEIEILKKYMTKEKPICFFTFKIFK